MGVTLCNDNPDRSMQGILVGVQEGSYPGD